MSIKKCLISCSAVLPLLASAAITMTGEPGKTDSIYRNGEPVVFKYKVTEDGAPKAGLLRYDIYREGFTPMERRFVRLDENGTHKLTLDARGPGNIIVRATLCDENKKEVVEINAKGKKKKFVRTFGAMVDPEKLASPFPEPADYDAFWEQAKKELAAVPMEIIEEREFPATKYPGKVRGFDVKVTAPGPTPVSGILAIPADAAPNSLPAVVVYHGAGVASAWLREDNAVNYNAMVFDVNAHGIPNHKSAKYYQDLGKGKLKNYLHRLGAEEPASNYFKYMILRDLRALEYLRSRPEWDGRIIVVTGGSQGGAQALLTASLDPQVTFCRANIPWMTVPAAPAKGYFQIPVQARQIHLGPKRTVKNPEAIERLGYFDAANAVKRMKAECVIVYGLRDELCPSSGVWMTYRNIPGKKTIFGAVDKGHQNIPAPDYIGIYLKKARKN